MKTHRLETLAGDGQANFSSTAQFDRQFHTLPARQVIIPAPTSLGLTKRGLVFTDYVLPVIREVVGGSTP